ncbi:MAG: type 2 isopentenyl-diphosphate Delta-isomerase [Gracilimonas sp.]|uniref:type 2 isopentenyl-diphosphate Delta-isomerase n=1 Tax=Gracilimonas TaxID=649462 RepID=UPI001B0FCC9A|nr:type 2 isopentenyl-diphosphate Delta-isomerase [Gracilimonas sp.]MBO6586391.1 type 2 isopentenyl-diphosphate Delta-isomerase [Gracilimonas sp.]MBO6615048.1 type 2 isopentenyl-diphosphate Delta-isomerase [Gracilimonas sp.]
MTDIRDRKKDHVELAVTEGTQYDQPSGFERYRFIHNALPEVNSCEVTTEASLLGRTFSMPLFISSMTGGYSEAGPVNAVIAEFCEAENLPFGVGSQRAMLEDESLTETFSVVREKAQNAFICSNIGGAQLIGGLDTKRLTQLVDSIQANAIIVHLNPLQELMQPEGDRDFKGIMDGIEQLVKDTQLPVIVKETGAGISEHTARRLLNVGVNVIDVAGAGGTSWAKVENFRSSNQSANHGFDEWGIPTVECIQQLSKLEWEQSFEIIASGGIRSAFDIAKSLCLGAHFAATAQPVIKAIKNDEYTGLEKLLNQWKQDLKTILTLLGCTSVQELSASHLQEMK